MFNEVTYDYEYTPKEEAYEGLLNEVWETLSEAARSIVRRADTEAFTKCMLHNLEYTDEQFSEAMDSMHLAANRITQQDREILTEIMRVGFLAASSIDPDDGTPAGYDMYRGGCHFYYNMSANMIGHILQESALDSMP